MGKPYINKDDFWSDVINSILLRPVWREPWPEEDPKPRTMGLQTFVDYCWKLIPKDSDDAWCFYLHSDQWWAITAVSDDKGTWNYVATNENLEEILRKLYLKIKKEYPERESRL